MAKIEFNRVTEYQKMLEELNISAEGMTKRAVYDGAKVIADAIKAATPVDTGDLRDCLGLSQIKDINGFIHTKLGFVGYDRKGAPNEIKVRVLESGSSTRKKHPFIRPTVNKYKDAAIAAMKSTFEKELKEKMKEK